MKCSPPGFSVHGILQANILEWGVDCHSRLHRNFPSQGSNPGLLPWRLFTVWATGKVLCQGEFWRWLCAQVVFRQPVCWGVGLHSHHGGGLAWGAPAPEPWFQSGSLQESSHRWIALTSVCVPTVSHRCPFLPQETLQDQQVGLAQALISERKVKSLSHVWLFATPWTVTYQAPPSMGFSRQEYWSGFPFPSPEDLPDPGTEPSLLRCRQTLYCLSHQGSLTKALLLPWVLVYTRHCVSPPRAELLFTPVLWDVCSQALVAFITKCSGHAASSLPDPKPRESAMGLRTLTLVGDLLPHNSSPACGSPTQGVMGFDYTTRAPLLPFCWVSSLHLWIRISFLVGSSLFLIGGVVQKWVGILVCLREEVSSSSFYSAISMMNKLLITDFLTNQCHVNRHNSTPSQWW